MALTKRNYVSGETVITATNLNDIQDSIIALEGKGLTKEEVVEALEYTPAKASDIPTTDISANTAARHSHSNKDVLDNIAEITSISGGAVTGGANALVTKEVLDATSQLIMDEIPSELKNPNALTVKIGSTTVTYDGSSAQTVEIADGTEVFYIDIAGSYPNYTCPVAMADIKAAYEAGKVLECRLARGQYIVTLPLFIPMPSANTWIFSGSGSLTEMGFAAQSLTIAIVNGTVQADNTWLASKDEIPTALKNPYALTFDGAATGSYDGSAAMTVNIPSAVTDDHINSLIDTKLGVIENGSY